MSRRTVIKAIGLASDDNGEIPRVVANAIEEDAVEIEKIARRFGIPVYERSDLVQGLASVPEGSTIPPSLFRAVATILNHVSSRVGLKRG